jgi:hypothetical protein
MSNVLIKWVDSNMAHEQTDIQPKPATIISVGHLVSEHEDYIVICRDDMGDDGWRSQIAIPNVCIIKKVVLKAQNLQEKGVV